MRKYLDVLKSAIKKETAYKFEFSIFIIATIVGMSVFYFVWTSIYSYNHVDVLGGLTLQQMITYVIISMAITPFIWHMTDRMIDYDITKGGITSMLTHPLRIQPYIFFRDSGHNIMAFLIQTIPSIILAFIIFKISIPNIFNLIAFFISAFMGLLISFSISFLVWLSAFWTEKSDGIRRFKEAIIGLFSGFLIPIYLFPAWIQPLLFLLPFQAIFNTPLSIFIEKVSGVQIIFALLVQVFWAAVLLLTGHIIWKKARIKYSAHGG